MDAGSYHKRPKHHKYGNGASIIFGQRFLIAFVLRKLPEVFGLVAINRGTVTTLIPRKTRIT